MKNKRVVKNKINVITLIIMPVTHTHTHGHFQVSNCYSFLFTPSQSLSLSRTCRCLCTPKFSSALADASLLGSRFSSPTCPTKCWIMHATWQSNYIIAWGVICSCICISPPAGWCSARLHLYQVRERMRAQVSQLPTQHARWAKNCCSKNYFIKKCNTSTQKRKSCKKS